VAGVGGVGAGVVPGGVEAGAVEADEADVDAQRPVLVVKALRALFAVHGLGRRRGREAAEVGQVRADCHWEEMNATSSSVQKISPLCLIGRRR
jgi:hypothetical protein